MDEESTFFATLGPKIMHKNTANMIINEMMKKKCEIDLEISWRVFMLSGARSFVELAYVVLKACRKELMKRLGGE